MHGLERLLVFRLEGKRRKKAADGTVNLHNGQLVEQCGARGSKQAASSASCSENPLLTKADDYIRQPKILVCGNSCCHGSKAHRLSSKTHTHTHEQTADKPWGRFFYSYCLFLYAQTSRIHDTLIVSCGFVMHPAESATLAVNKSPIISNSY